MQGDLVAKFAYPVCQMKTGYLYLFKEQSKRGRVVLAYKDHVSEMIDISDEDRNAFFAEVAQVARAVHKVFNPDVYKRQGMNDEMIDYMAKTIREALDEQ